MSERQKPEPRRPRLLRSGKALAGLAILTCVALAALFAPWLAPYDPLEQSLLERRQPPSLEHPLGLDEVGRDNLSRILYGARLSLRVGVTSVAVAVAIGGVLGAAAGYRGGWLDSLTMSVTDVMQAIPTLLLAMVVVVILGRGLTNVVYAVAIAAIPTYTRLTRVGVLSTKQRDHVLAARAIGAPHIVLFPGLAILVTVLGFNLLGDGLRDAMDPRAAV